MTFNSFDYIIKNRRFLYDSASREYDKNIAYTKAFFKQMYQYNEDIDIDSVYKAALDKKALNESKKAKKKKK